MPALDTVRRFIAVFNDRNAPALMDIYAPDIVESTGDGDVLFGAVEVNRYHSYLFQQQPDIEFHDVKLSEGDNVVVATWRMEAKDQDNLWRPYFRDGVDIYVVEANRIASRETYFRARNLEPPAKLDGLIKRAEKTPPGRANTVKTAKAYAAAIDAYDGLALANTLLHDDVMLVDDSGEALEGKDAVLDRWLDFFEQNPDAVWVRNEALGTEMHGARSWELAMPGRDPVEGVDLLSFESGKILVIQTYSKRRAALPAEAVASLQ